MPGKGASLYVHRDTRLGYIEALVHFPNGYR